MDIENANCKLKVSQCASLNVTPIPRPIKINHEISNLEKLIQELHAVFSTDYVNVQDVQKLMAGYKSDPNDWRKFAKFDRFRYTRNLVDAGNGLFNVMILCWGPGHASAVHDHADSHCFMKILSGNLEEVRFAWPENVQPEVLKKLNNNIRSRCDSDSEVVRYTTQNLRIEEINLETNAKIETHSSDEVRNHEHFTDVNKKHDINDNVEVESVGENLKEIGRTRLKINDVCYINDTLGLHRMENPTHVDEAVSLHLYCPPFDTCQVFDERTGNPTKVKATFWSIYGKKVKRVTEAKTIAGSQ